MLTYNVISLNFGKKMLIKIVNDFYNQDDTNDSEVSDMDGNEEEKDALLDGFEGELD